MTKKHKHKKAQKHDVERAESLERTGYVERDKSARRGDLAELERRENLERELTYAKSEIGTVAGRLLKYTPFPRRVAVIGIVVVLALGVGVVLGVHQIRSVFGSGDGVIEAVTGDDSQPEDLPAEKDGDAKAEPDTETEPDTDANNKGRPVASASFTKGADGIYRWHGDAGPVRYHETWNDEYTFDIPAEIRTSAEPHVLHIQLRLRNDVEARGKKGTDVVVYSSPKDRMAFHSQNVYFLPSEEWGSAELSDSYVPFLPNNPHVDEELTWLKLQSRGVDVDLEFLTVSQAPLPTWDGHSTLEQKESGFFRVTGPITVTHLRAADTDYVVVYGYRRGDSSFTPLARLSGLTSNTTDSYKQTELSGDEFVTRPYTLDGIELLWVETAGMNKGAWSLE